MPQFEHLLIDQTELRPEAVVGEPVAQVAMMAITRGAPDELLDQTVRLMVEVSPDGEVEVLARHVEYVLAATRSQERREAFAAVLRRRLPGSGGELMNYVEQIEARGRQAGLQEGEQRALLKTARRLLRRDVPWSIIEEATGLDEATFRRLDQQFDGSN